MGCEAADGRIPVRGATSTWLNTNIARKCAQFRPLVPISASPRRRSRCGDDAQAAATDAASPPPVAHALRERRNGPPPPPFPLASTGPTLFLPSSSFHPLPPPFASYHPAAAPCRPYHGLRVCPRDGDTDHWAPGGNDDSGGPPCRCGGRPPLPRRRWCGGRARRRVWRLWGGQERGRQCRRRRRYRRQSGCRRGGARRAGAAGGRDP